jgi:hypothetical protein
MILSGTNVQISVCGLCGHRSSVASMMKKSSFKKVEQKDSQVEFILTGREEEEEKKSEYS